MKKPLIIASIILGVIGIVVLNMFVAKTIWESDLPTWLKIMFIK